MRCDLQLNLHLEQLEVDLPVLHGDVRERDREVVDGITAIILALHCRAELIA
jgi:hypothetical protein